MKRLQILAATLLMISGLAPQAATQGSGTSVTGVWKLTSYTRQDVATGKATNLFGEAPPGYAHYTPGGRFIVHFVRQDRKVNQKADLTEAESLEAFKTLVAYAGTYRIEGDKVIQRVEVAYVPSWVGTTRTVYAQRVGNKLTLTTSPFKSRLDGTDIVVVTVWDRQE